MNNARAEYVISNLDLVLERLRQATACINAIENVLLDREVNPEEDTLDDRVLQGLASAAGELLRQANAAATRDALRPGRERAIGSAARGTA